jgi:flavodoxin
MKIQIIYCSVKNKTTLVANYFDNALNIKVNPIIDCDLLIILCPTYGDEELPLEMEDYLLNIKINNLKYFTICELGNYYGYEDFTFGAGIILKKYFEELGFEEFYYMLSLDSIPKIDWNCFERWKSKLYEKIHLYNCV